MSGQATEDTKQGRANHFYRVSAREFERIPGSPISYWVSSEMKNIFVENTLVTEEFEVLAGISTGKNDAYIFYWHEIDCDSIRTKSTQFSRFAQHNKGGQFRKWYGNRFYVLKYNRSSLRQMEQQPGFRHDGMDFYFKEHIGWSKVTSGLSSFRLYDAQFTFDSAGLGLFAKSDASLFITLGFLNSKVAQAVIGLLNPTLNVTPKIVRMLPLIMSAGCDESMQKDLVRRAKQDFDSYENSLDFTTLPLIRDGQQEFALERNYDNLRAHWREMTLEMQRLEEENNRIFIEEYGLQDELEPDVPLEEITLTCNPHYRYRGDRTEEELEALLLADTMREFISYAVGCMFGRYSLDEPGLILANQGDTHADYLARVPEPTFAPDENNVIPILDEDWFTDEITYRFRDFLRTTFGEDHYQENLAFLEQALNVNNRRHYTLRDYFLKDFYDDHVRRYQKRPIYWLFSSPKGSFNALVYLHRYQPDTVSVVLRYLREYQAKLQTAKNQQTAVISSENASRSDKTRAQREVERLNRVLAELEDYERDTLYPLATEQVELDLDDGVKVNYPKLGKALKRVTGLS